MNSFLLEILVQELPYKFIPSAIEQLKKAFETLFLENGISFKNIDVHATPRRLAVIISDFAQGQADSEKKIKGPILKIARDENGNLTPAGLGFKNKNNAKDEDLYEEEGYIFAKVKQKGVSTKEVLKNNIESIILKLQGAHFMRWGHLEVKFSRPIENIVALYNEEVLDLKVIDKISTRTTLGHRYCPNNKIEIKSPETYFEQLKSVNVIVNTQERLQKIKEGAIQKAKEINAEIKFDDELTQEVLYITEWPVPVLCYFDEKYLKIPDIVSTTVMSKHQRYFPLFKNGKLLNNFITMANFVGTEGFENIQNGNQRVVTARLEDGIFFYNEDTKTPLIEKFENLKGITFQKGLGNLYDKTLRMENISKYLCEKLNLSKEDILRTARLSKIDLSTFLVFEFTELQGYIGADYARVSNEKENVSNGILEHYFPLNATSDVAKGVEGQIVGIADKIDTICAIFVSTQNDKKKRPTGSNDPLGVRRAVLGVLRTILNCNLNIDLEELINFTVLQISKEFNIEIAPETKGEIIEFILNRLVILLSQEYDKEVLEACYLGALKDLNNYIKKVVFASSIVKNADFSTIHENTLRIIRILAKETPKEVSGVLFVNNGEKALYDFVKNNELNSFENLLTLARKIEEFFNTSLVMDKDLKIRENRIALLGFVKSKFEQICDFSKIII